MYAVIWKTFLLDRLADIYVLAGPGERTRIAVGLTSFNDRLAIDPFEVGESRDGGYRVAFPPLLQVSFHVDKASYRVRVTDIIRYGS